VIGICRCRLVLPTTIASRYGLQEALRQTWSKRILPAIHRFHGSNFISPEFSLHEDSTRAPGPRLGGRKVAQFDLSEAYNPEVLCCQCPRAATSFFPRISARRDSYDRWDVKDSIVRNVNASMVLAQRLVRTLDLGHNATNNADANVPRILAACTTLRTPGLTVHRGASRLPVDSDIDVIAPQSSEP
jgi:hypothetical protein